MKAMVCNVYYYILYKVNWNYLEPISNQYIYFHDFKTHMESHVSALFAVSSSFAACLSTRQHLIINAYFHHHIIARYVDFNVI